MKYDQFAYIYDDLMSDAPYTDWVAYTKQIVAKYGSGNRNRLIDIGCGTGTLALLLAKEAFDVTGVDLSENMLAVAQQKAFDAGVSLPLFQMDMTEISGFGTFEVATVFCDSLNYLPAEEDVRKTFRSVRDLLKPNGLFLFDVHTLYKINTIFKDKTFADDSEDLSFIWQCEQVHEEGSVEHQLSFFIQDDDGRYSRFNESHLQRTFALEWYEQWLRETGFTIVSVTADFSSSAPDPSSERLFFAAKKEDSSTEERK